MDISLLSKKSTGFPNIRGKAEMCWQMICHENVSLNPSESEITLKNQSRIKDTLPFKYLWLEWQSDNQSEEMLDCNSCVSSRFLLKKKKDLNIVEWEMLKLMQDIERYTKCPVTHFSFPFQMCQFGLLPNMVYLLVFVS